jgi:multiple sugar transport system substrate-binding protein
MSKQMSRRELLRLMGMGCAGAALAACQPRVVKETVVVEKESEKEVTRIVKETVVVKEKAVPEEVVVLDFMNRGNEYIKEVANQQIALFNEGYPHIKIMHDLVPGNWREKMMMRIAAGTPPDCFFDAGYSSGIFWRQEVTLNLEPFLEAEPTFKEDDYTEGCWFTCTFEGKRYGLPWDTGFQVLAYNADLLDEAGVEYPDVEKPMTWDDLIEKATQLTFDLNGKRPGESDFDPARIKQYGFGGASAYHVMSHVVYTNGGELINADLTCPIDSPEFIEAIQYAVDLGLKHFVAPSAVYPQAEAFNLQNKNVAMAYMWAHQCGQLTEVGVNWQTAPNPINTTPAAYGHYSPWAVTTFSEHPKEAFDFIYQSTCTYEGQKILVDMGMLQPTRKDLIDLFVQNAPPDPKYRQVFFDVVDVYRVPGDTIGSYFNGSRAPMQDYFIPTVDPVFLGKVRYEEIMAEVRPKLEQVMRTGETP